PPSDSETVSIGATQNSCAPGACRVTRTFCQPSSTRSKGAGSAPEKRKLCGPDGVSKKRSGSVGAKKFRTDSIPSASGRASGAESVSEISQLTSQPCGAGPNRKSLETER